MPKPSRSGASRQHRRQGKVRLDRHFWPSAAFHPMTLDPSRVPIHPDDLTMPTASPHPQPAPMAPAAERPHTVDVLGVQLALTDYERTMDWIDDTIARRGRGYVIPAAVH